MQNEIKKAIKTLSTAMKEDPQYAYSWHANIAVCCQDAGASHAVSNDGAARFMKLCFGVDTSKTNG